MTTVEVFAPAKINLALHVTGRRDDGYHELDTLVTFAGVGDRLRISGAESVSLAVDGPEATGVPTGPDNLVLRAAASIAPRLGLSFSLEKWIPVASGVGGGSADAAAAIRGTARYCMDADIGAPPDRVLGDIDLVMASLGADIPMCHRSSPQRARGTGDRLNAVALPSVFAVLVNPRVPVSTPEVFAALNKRDNEGLPDMPERFVDAAALIDWLGGCRNDLQPAALTVTPVIGDVLDALSALKGARLVRMSGSGATCFALFTDEERARAAAERLRRDRPDWWVVDTVLRDWSEAAMPRVI